MLSEAIQVLDRGFVRLLDHMGSDLTVVNAARVSFGKRKEHFEESDAQLVQYLAEHEHTSPFRHTAITFHVKAPIFVFRQWMKHRIGCLSGQVRVSFLGPEGEYQLSMEELWEMWKAPLGEERVRNLRIRLLDESAGCFREGRIEDVLEKGSQPIYEMTLSDGKQIHLTENHRIMTTEGWMTMGQAVGLTSSGQMCRSPKLLVNGKTMEGPRLLQGVLRKRPMSSKTHRVRGATSFRILSTQTHPGPFLVQRGEFRCQRCRHVQARLSPGFFKPVWIHGRLFYGSSNLPLHCAQCVQGESEVQGKPPMVPLARSVVQLRFLGEAPTFDLRIQGPWHNFLANGIVVHNSEFNEISGRYVEFQEGEFYFPEQFRRQAKVNKQGSEGSIEADQCQEARRLYLDACERSLSNYKALLDLGVCREQARCILPLGLYSEVHWTASLQAVAHFLRLRTDAHAQWEIQQYAHAVRQLTERLFPVSLPALLHP